MLDSSGMVCLAFILFVIAGKLSPRGALIRRGRSFKNFTLGEVLIRGRHSFEGRRSFEEIRYSITIYSLLLAFKLSLLILIQVDISSSSFFKSVTSSSTLSDAIFTYVSPAYTFEFTLSKQFSKSLMCNMKSKGPKHGACGIPHFKIGFTGPNST